MNLFEFQRHVLMSDLTSAEKLLMMALASHGSGPAPWSVWPGNATLARMTSSSLSTLQRTLRQLEKSGWISRDLTHESGRAILVGGSVLKMSTHTQNEYGGVVKMSMGGYSKLPPPPGQNEYGGVVKMSMPLYVEGPIEDPIELTTEDPRERENSALRSAARTPAQDKAQAGAGSLSLDKCWSDLWGGGAPCPPALLHLERSRGMDAALTALAWLLHRRATEGVKSPGRVAQYLAEDFATGRRDARGWTEGELRAVREGAYPGDFWACEQEEVEPPPKQEEAMISEEERQALLARMRAAREAFFAPERRGL